MKKRMLAVLLATAMIAAVTGCSGSSGNSGTNTPETTVAQTQAAQGQGETKETPSEPVELWFTVREDESTLPSGSVEVLKESVKEKFNVELKVDCINKSSYEEKINVMIASGEFPDIIDATAIPRLGEAVEGGMLIPVDDLISSDPLWSTADPAIFQKFSYKDQRYGLPVVMDRPDGIYYRTDWLEKLGLSIPTNADELYEVLKAFATQDPDGNGKDDTYGLTMSSEYSQTAPLWHLFLAANPIGADLGFYIDTKTGKADNVFNHKEDMAEALTWFNRLYNEGILEKEYILNTSEDAESKFITGKAGCWFKGVLWIEPRKAKIQAANPDADILCFPNMEGNYGVNLKQQPTGRALYLTRAASDQEELAKQVLSYIAGPDGMKDLYLGKEGVTYTIDGDTIHWTNPDDASKYNPGNILSSPFDIELPVPSAALQENLEITSDYEISPLIQVSSSAVFNEKGADMKKVILEGITKIIIGEESISYLDTMIEDLNSLGMAEACEEMNITD